MTTRHVRGGGVAAGFKEKRIIQEECHKLTMDLRGWYSMCAVKPNKDFAREVRVLPYECERAIITSDGCVRVHYVGVLFCIICNFVNECQ